MVQNIWQFVAHTDLNVSCCKCAGVNLESWDDVISRSLAHFKLHDVIRKENYVTMCQ